jgi:hypothetical protein
MEEAEFVALTTWRRSFSTAFFKTMTFSIRFCKEKRNGYKKCNVLLLNVQSNDTNFISIATFLVGIRFRKPP